MFLKPSLIAILLLGAVGSSQASNTCHTPAEVLSSLKKELPLTTDANALQGSMQIERDGVFERYQMGVLPSATGSGKSARTLHTLAKNATEPVPLQFIGKRGETCIYEISKTVIFIAIQPVG